MDGKVLESVRLRLKPLSFSELLSISKNENIETIIESEAISSSVKSAISKKLVQRYNCDCFKNKFRI